MSFRLGDIIVDRIQYGWAESISDGTPLYTLSQLNEGSIELTSEAEEKRDKDGNLVLKIYKSKGGTFSATNAFINSAVMAATSGSDAVFASTDKGVVMPRIAVVPAGGKIAIPGYVEGTVTVAQLTPDGSLGATNFVKGTTATNTADGKGNYNFAITGDGDTAELTVPKVTNADGEVLYTQFIVRYDRTVKDGIKISNTVDKFPKSVRLILKVLYYDPCEKDVLKSCYIELPSFKISPDTTITFNTEGTMDISGDLEYSYCGCEKALYNIYFVDDGEKLSDSDFCLD